MIGGNGGIGGGGGGYDPARIGQAAAFLEQGVDAAKNTPGTVVEAKFVATQIGIGETQVEGQFTLRGSQRDGFTGADARPLVAALRDAQFTNAQTFSAIHVAQLNEDQKNVLRQAVG